MPTETIKTFPAIEPTDAQRMGYEALKLTAAEVAQVLRPQHATELQCDDNDDGGDGGSLAHRDWPRFR